MRVLIVGGNRFMGYGLTWRLLAAGHRVTHLNRGLTRDPFGERIGRLTGDRTTGDYARHVAGRSFDAVVDFAAFVGADAQGAAEALRDRVGHYVFISTGQVYLVREGWTYGLSELAPAQREALRTSRRISNPGCYPISLILGLRPLIEAGLLPAEAPITIHALSGYTGGGRQLIERWEDPARALLRLPFEAPYALDRVHKHILEMTRWSGLAGEPQFVPAVGPFPTGMRVEVPLHACVLARGASGKAVWEALATRYAGEPFVRVAPYAEALAQDEL